MSKIIWDKLGERYYEAGISHGVLYVQDPNGEYPNGVAWNGLISVTEKPSGAEAKPLYAGNIKYVNLRSAEEFGATIETYTYPDEFNACIGAEEVVPGVLVGQQTYKNFGLAYRTILGNDVEYNDHGYKLHLVYGSQASPTEKEFGTINADQDAATFSFEMTTTPVPMTGFKPTSILTIISTDVDAAKLKALEDILYGTEEAEARLPLPDEVATIMAGSISG